MRLRDQIVEWVRALNGATVVLAVPEVGRVLLCSSARVYAAAVESGEVAMSPLEIEYLLASDADQSTLRAACYVKRAFRGATICSAPCASGTA